MSLRSEARGLSFEWLPAEGYSGEIPEFPVPGVTSREIEVWESLWRSPQAAAWAVQPWRWSNVADLARLMVLSEAEKAPVAVFTHIRQARADLGLTPAGLVENGWQIADGTVAAPSSAAPAARKTSSGDWLKAVSVEGA
jgi:hypothetical protein